MRKKGEIMRRLIRCRKRTHNNTHAQRGLGSLAESGLGLLVASLAVKAATECRQKGEEGREERGMEDRGWRERKERQREADELKLVFIKS